MGEAAARSAPGPAAGAGPLRTLIHLVVVAGGWVGFVWMWIVVARQPWDSVRLVWLIVGSFVIAPVLTAAWVAHNRAIHRRKGERRAVAVADTRYRRDWRRRVVKADWAAMAVSPVVTIDIDEDGCKRYLGVASSRASRAHAVQPARPPRREDAELPSAWMDTVQG